MYSKLFSSLEKAKILYVKWDLNKEKLSLGGLLVLKQEIQLLKKYFSLKKVIFVVDSKAVLQQKAFIAEILGRDAEIQVEDKKIEAQWPLFEKGNFSYQSFSRIKFLYTHLQMRPELLWDEKLLQKANIYRKKISGKCFALHLKQVGNHDPQESNANIIEWAAFLKKAAKEQKATFVLLGKDRISEDIMKMKNVRSAELDGLSLSEQLAFISVSDGFLGQASGICQAAIFSSVPYVIFKHPLHHVEEMKREIGDKDVFCFAREKQRFLRKLDTLENIEQAFNFINPVVANV